MVLFQKRKIYRYGDSAIYVERRNKKSIHVVVFEYRDTIEFMYCCHEVQIQNHTGFDANLQFYMNGDVEECLSPTMEVIRATDVLDTFEMDLLFIPHYAKIDSLNIHHDGIYAKSAISDYTNWWSRETWEGFE